MRTRPVSVLLVASLLLAGACSDDDPEDASSTTTTTAACTADDADATELEGLVVDAVPEGFEPQPDDVGDTGPSDLAKAVRDDGQEDAAEVLTALGFRRGYQRLWLNEGGEQLIVFLYEFCDAEGATGHEARTADLLVSAAGFEEIEVTGIDGAQGFSNEGGGDAAVTVIAPAGEHHVQAVAFAPAGTSTVDELTARAEALLEAQLAELGTS